MKCAVARGNAANLARMEFGAFLWGQQACGSLAAADPRDAVGKGLRCRALTGMRNSVGQRPWPSGQAASIFWILDERIAGELGVSAAM